MDARLGRWAKVAGSAIAVVSIIFIGALFWKERDVLSSFRPDMGSLAALAFSALSYAFLGLVLSDAWRHLLLWTGEPLVPSGEARRIYAQTQIAKYIPGNVAQFAGRQVLGRQAGWTHTGLLLSVAFELLSLVFVAAAIATMTIATGASGVFASRLPEAIGIAGILIAFALVLLRLGPRLLIERWPDSARRLSNLKLRELWVVSAYHTLFFVSAGLLFVLVTAATLGEPVPYQQWLWLIGLFAVAWIVSTLTPGAPAGMGVREVVLVAGLALVTTAGTAVLVATLWRAVTVTGDLLFYLVAGAPWRGK